ncbi:SDR family oxidoreductase [Parvularcula sp. IMCC14364]|uniref:SDR family oxidoreductase n=1 Tax=Parvularcula sp. IMCC14364 TaxID=3067902 RepID=UPI002740494B|nr:SDR family oxidoreductase [Parvularcula sp. IMCC14364]
MTGNQPSRTALVTGGAVRIGRQLAVALAHADYHVIIHYRASNLAAEELANEIRKNGGAASTLQADLLNRAHVGQLIANAGSKAKAPISILVNCASAFEDDSVETFTDESWDTHMDVHLRTPMMLAQRFAQQIDADADNQIINIIDQRVWALTPKFFTYTLSKAALWTATQTLAQALGPKGIRVNAIGPGPTLKNKRQSDEDWQKQNDATILGYGATPDDIAAALLYLLSAKAVTGQMIAVDGGQHLAWETPDLLVNE